MFVGVLANLFSLKETDTARPLLTKLQSYNPVSLANVKRLSPTSATFITRQLLI